MLRFAYMPHKLIQDVKPKHDQCLIYKDAKCLFFQWKHKHLHQSVCSYRTETMAIKSTQVLECVWVGVYIYIYCTISADGNLLPAWPFPPSWFLTNTLKHDQATVSHHSHTTTQCLRICCVYIYMCLCATFYALLNHSGAVVVSSGIIFIYVSLFYLNIWQWCSALMCALCFGKERSVYMCVGGSHFSIKGLPGKKTWHLWDKRRETDQKSKSERKKKQYQIFLNTQLEGFNFLWEPCVRDGRKAPPQPSL